MLSYIKKYNFFVLVGGLLGFLLLTPLLQHYTGDAFNILMLWALCLTLLIQVWSLIENAVMFRVGMILTVLSFFLTGMGQLYPNTVFINLMSTLTFLMFFSLVLVIAVKEVFSRASITANTFAGALSLYLVLGMIWTLLYILVATVEPAAFKGLAQPATTSELIYFSYITLTSLGYGDIVALMPVTRTLAYLEVIIGQFYMAVLVGALVGKYIANHK